MNAGKIGSSIISFATQFSGLIEVLDNTQWDDPSTEMQDPQAAIFRRGIERYGHIPGNPYCMSAAKYWFIEGHKKAGFSEEKALRLLLHELNPSVMFSFNNFLKLGLIKKEPIPGSIFFMKRRNNPSKGHGGIITDATSSTLYTIEANTIRRKTGKGGKKDYAGNGIFEKERSFTFGSQDLTLVGFLHPFEDSALQGIASSLKDNPKSIFNKVNTEAFAKKAKQLTSQDRKKLIDDIFKALQ